MKKKATPLSSLFLEELKNVLGAETHQLVLFPMLKRACCCQPLRNVMARGLDDAKEHIARLEQAFSILGEKAIAPQPEGILGLGREAEQVIASTPAGSATRDVGLVMVTQQIKHYAIAAYGQLTQLARDLELDEVLDLLEMTLNEEKEADELLTAVAENYVNADAARE